MKHNQTQLAAVEATQSMEIVFTLAGEMLLLGLVLPALTSLIGIVIITLGIVVYCFLNSKIKENTLKSIIL
ncbi:hypothetical protein GCM10007203_04180 [Staphylococcus nepalensis]|nr:hypothetical protein GCM10007203_04180 [Staphylococcus nepalensis]